MIRLIGLLLVFVGALLLAFKNDLLLLFNPPSIIIVLLPALLAPLVAMAPGRVGAALKAIFSGGKSGSRSDAARLLGIVGKTSLSFGVIMTVAGAVLILAKFDPEKTTQLALCRASAVALLTLIFGWLGKAVCDALAASLEPDAQKAATDEG